MVVTLTWDLSVEGAAILERIERLGEDMTPVMDKVGEILADAARRRIRETNEAPDGAPWKPSIRAASDGGLTLYVSGRLERGIQAHPRADGVDVVNLENHAAIHQFGGTIKPKTAQKLAFQIAGGWVVVGEVTIPARPYLGVSEEDAAAIEDALVAHLRGEAP